MAKRRTRRRVSKRKKGPIKYDPTDLSNIVACLGEIKDIMLILVEQIERIENTPPEVTSDSPNT